MLPLLDYTSAQFVDGYCRQAARQCLLWVRNSPARSVGRYWRHAARQYLLERTGSLPLSPSAGTDGIWLVSVFFACEFLLLGPSAGTMVVGFLAQSVALCSVATLSQYMLFPSALLLSTVLLFSLVSVSSISVSAVCLSVCLSVCRCLSLVLSLSLSLSLSLCFYLSVSLCCSFLYPRPTSRLGLATAARCPPIPLSISTLEATSPLIPLQQTLGWAHRCYFDT